MNSIIIMDDSRLTQTLTRLKDALDTHQAALLEHKQLIDQLLLLQERCEHLKYTMLAIRQTAFQQLPPIHSPADYRPYNAKIDLLNNLFRLYGQPLVHYKYKAIERCAYCNRQLPAYTPGTTNVVRCPHCRYQSSYCPKHDSRTLTPPQYSPSALPVYCVCRTV